MLRRAIGRAHECPITGTWCELQAARVTRVEITRTVAIAPTNVSAGQQQEPARVFKSRRGDSNP